MLDGLILFCKSDFRSEVYLGWFLMAAFISIGVIPTTTILFDSQTSSYDEFMKQIRTGMH